MIILAGNIKVQLNLLVDALQMKKDNLNNIQRLTMLESDVLSGEAGDDTALEELYKEKQGYIESVNRIDVGFKITFDRIKGVLIHQSELYADYISKMQDLIKEIGELDISIRVQEKKNETQLNIRNKSKKHTQPVMDARKAAQYYLKQKNITKPGSYDETK